jgi:hypothetical protein
LAKDGGSGVVVTDKAKAIDDQAKSDIFYLLLTVLGTLFFISAIMVSRRSVSRHNLLTLIKIGIAYWAGARFDVALKELTKGNIFPNKETILDTQRGNVIGGPSHRSWGAIIIVPWVRSAYPQLFITDALAFLLRRWEM